MAVPDAEPRVTISTNGGHSPVWSADGSELFYVEGDRLMAVAVEAAPDLRVETPRDLFRGSFVPFPDTNYDVSPDGQRFVMVQGKNTGSQQSVLHFVLHFDEELRQRLP